MALSARARREYRHERAKGIEASHAISIARMYDAHQAFGWQDGEGNELLRKAFTRDGFTILVTVAYDEYMQLDEDCGTWVKYRDAGCIVSEYARIQLAAVAGVRYRRYRMPRRIQSRKQALDVSSGGYREDWQLPYFDPGKGATAKDMLPYMKKRGMARGPAWVAALKTVYDLEQYRLKWYSQYGGAADMFYVDIRVTVTFAGEEVGSASCGGIGTDEHSDPYFTEMAEDLMTEALEEAKQRVPERARELAAKAAELEAKARELIAN